MSKSFAVTSLAVMLSVATVLVAPPVRFAAAQKLPQLKVMGEVLGQQAAMMTQWKNTYQVNLTYTNGGSKRDIEGDLLGPRVFEVYQGTASFVPTWADRGYIEDLTEDVKDPEVRWHDFASQARDQIASYNGRVWGVPIDMDPVLFYYRRDLVAKAPASWEELIDAARSFHMTDLNGDGIPDAGFCMTMADYVLMTIATSVMKTDSGYRKGPFFDINADERTPMTSTMKTEGWAYALRVVSALFNVSHFKLPDLKNRSYFSMTDSSPLMRSGRCAFMLGLTAAGTYSLQSTASANATFTFWRGKEGATRPPGSTMAYDRATKKLVECTPRNCPNMETPNVNRPGFINGGGIMVMRKGLNATQKEIAKSFMFWASNRIDVRRFGGINPFRKSQMNASYFVEAASIGFPWDFGDAQSYLGAILESMELPSAYNAPRFSLYTILSNAASAAIKEMCRVDIYKNFTTSEYDILDNMEKTWRDAMVQQGQTLDENEAQLRKSYGLPSLINERETYWWISLIVLAVAAVAGYALYRKLSRVFAVANAPRDASSFAASFVVVKGVALLWEQAPDDMPAALAQFTMIVKKAASANGAYVARKVGDNFLLTADSSVKLVATAGEIQRKVQNTAWSKFFRSANGSSAAAGGNTTGTVVVVDGPESQRSRHRRATVAPPKGLNRSVSLRSAPHAPASESSDESEGGATGRSHRSSLHRGYAARKCIDVGISVTEGAGRIEYTEETNVYDYNGGAVEEAALIADVSRAGQTLVSDVSYASIDAADVAGSFVVVGPRAMRGRSVEIFQFNPQDVRVRVYHSAKGGKGGDKEGDNNSDEDVDSVAAALDASNSGLAIKKITVLTVFVFGVDVAASESEKESMIKRYHEIYAVVDDIVRGSKGSILSFEGGRFVITFNAFAPTPAQVKRAGLVALDIRDALQQELHLRCVCGLASGRALVGIATASGKTAAGSREPHKALVGNVLNRALSLERLALHYPRTCSILASTAIIPELASAVYCQVIDVVRFAALGNGESDPRLSAPQPVTTIVALMCSPADDDGAGDDEWMYTLAKNDARNPFAKSNAVFEHVAAGHFDEAFRAFNDMTTTPTASPVRDERAATIESSDRTGLERLQRMFADDISKYFDALPNVL